MKYLNFLNKNLDRVKGPVEACTTREVDEFESRLNIRLPEAYKECLLVLGKQHGEVFSGSIVEFKHLEYLQKLGRKIIEECLHTSLAKDDFVIATHQGYSVCYFNLNEGEDPPVYLFVEGDEPAGIRRKWESFSDYLFFMLDCLVKINRNLSGERKTSYKSGDPPVIER